MALDNYSNDDDSSGGPKKTTYYQFENPSHPESKEFANPERAQEHFDAAQYVQTQLGTDRHGLVGEFLVAVQQLDQNDDDQPLKDLVEKLRS